MNQVIGVIIFVILLAVFVMFFLQMRRAERIKKLKEQLAEAKHDVSEWKLRHHAVEQMYRDAQNKYEALQMKLAERTKEKFFKLDRKSVDIYDEQLDN